MSRVIDIDAGRALCAAATQGLRHVDDTGECEGVVIASVGDFYEVCVENLFDGEADVRADARYIATFDPATVDVLLVELQTHRLATDELVAAVEYLAHVAAHHAGVAEVLKHCPPEARDLVAAHVPRPSEGLFAPF